MREARGPEWTDWLARARRRRADRDRHPLARPPPARARARCARQRSRRPLAPDDVLAEIRPTPHDGRRSARGPCVHTHTYVYSDAGSIRVAVVDYGCKRSILRRLASRGGPCDGVPMHNAPPTSSPGHDAVLLSNGPGDPEPLRDEVETVRELLGRVPVLGICLGHQLLGLATGHETYKLPFGHRGANHPVLDRRTGRVLVTSQNHGFAVAPTRRRGGDARLPLRRHRRGLRLPRAARPLGAVPPRGRPGPARRVAACSSSGSRR